MPDIVYIDDDPREFMSLSKDAEAWISAFAFNPEDDHHDALEAAKAAKVWVFDFFLIASPKSESTDENGLSLFQKWKVAASGRATTVVVSSDLAKAVGEALGPVERHHVIAQKHGVEWIGDKSKATFDRVIALADAAVTVARKLQLKTKNEDLGTYEADCLCFDVLGVKKDVDWANSAQRQIDRARPPREVPTSSEAATARSIIGWLLAHVLPYPSFLLTDAQAALRLQITPATFRALADAFCAGEADDPHRKRFVDCLYQGPLSNFLGRRWWRAAVDDFAWHLAQDEGGFRPCLQKLAGATKVEWLDHSEPVLLSDADLVETDEVAEAAECVRVTDEDFPANVDAAWVRIASALEDQQLAAKVIYEDRPLLGGAG